MGVNATSVKMRDPFEVTLIATTSPDVMGQAFYRAVGIGHYASLSPENFWYVMQMKAEEMTLNLTADGLPVSDLTWHVREWKL